MAQSVEHVIGNDEVISSILITSSKNKQPTRVALFFYLDTTVTVCYNTYRIYKKEGF